MTHSRISDINIQTVSLQIYGETIIERGGVDMLGIGICLALLGLLCLIGGASISSGGLICIGIFVIMGSGWCFFTSYKDNKNRK